MTILFVEIVIFEIFLSSGKQLKNHIIQYTVKFVAFVLTISNLVQYETCENLNRDVRSYILLVFNTWYTFLIHLLFMKVALWSMLATWTYFFSIVSINPHIGTETLIFMKVLL